MLYEYSPENWEIDTNGFMRCRARFLAQGTMAYAKDELGEAAQNPDFDNDGVYHLFVDEDSLSDPHALKSLEGLPVLMYDHEWTGPDQEYTQIGSVAGTVKADGGYSHGEIVITHPKAIADIQAGKLREVSSAYEAKYDMTPGEHDGKKYDGKQINLRYNHIALLPIGEGRAGSKVRILNHNQTKGSEKMSDNDFQSIDLGSGQTVRVMNADASVMRNFVQNSAEVAENAEEAKKQVDNMGGMESLAENMKAYNELKTKNEELTAQMAEKEGELTAVKEQLENMLSPEAMEAAVEEMAEEKEEASEMLAEHTDMDKEKAMNSLKGLRGHELQLHVVNTIRTENGNKELAKAEGQDDKEFEGFVKGQYTAYSGMKTKNTKPKTKVAGAGIVKTTNSGGQGNGLTGTQKLGYAKKKEQ